MVLSLNIPFGLNLLPCMELFWRSWLFWIINGLHHIQNNVLNSWVSPIVINFIRFYVGIWIQVSVISTFAHHREWLFLDCALKQRPRQHLENWETKDAYIFICDYICIYYIFSLSNSVVPSIKTWVYDETILIKFWWNFIPTWTIIYKNDCVRCNNMQLIPNELW